MWWKVGDREGDWQEGDVAKKGQKVVGPVWEAGGWAR